MLWITDALRPRECPAMPGIDLLLRGLGVARSVLGVGGRYRAAQLVGLVLALGWFVYAATDYSPGAFGLGTPDDRPVTVCHRDTDRHGNDDGNGDSDPGTDTGNDGTVCWNGSGTDHRPAGQRFDVPAPSGLLLAGLPLGGASGRLLQGLS